jgi:hypothetical protein
MTDQPLDDREDAEAEPRDDLLEAQEGKGYGADEREREESPPDE